MFKPSFCQRHSRLHVLIGIAAFCTSLNVSLAADPITPPAVPKPKTELQRLTAEIASNDPERVKAAIPQVRALIAQNKKTSYIVADSVRLLLNAKAYDGIDEIVKEYVILYPNDCAWMLKARVTALLGSGKKQEALAAAKIYYNYVPLDQTMDAIGVVSQALLSARPEDKDIIRRFKKEQLAGSQTQPATAPTTASASILDSIKVDGKAFQEAADRVNLDGYFSYCTKGSLLLMASNGKEAREVFEQAKAMVDGNKLGDAISNVARAIRTENGCVGPANTYILKMRENPDQ